MRPGIAQKRTRGKKGPGKRGQARIGNVGKMGKAKRAHRTSVLVDGHGATAFEPASNMSAGALPIGVTELDPFGGRSLARLL